MIVKTREHELANKIMTLERRLQQANETIDWQRGKIDELIEVTLEQSKKITDLELKRMEAFDAGQIRVYPT